MRRNPFFVVALLGSLAVAACGSSGSEATPASTPGRAVTADSVADATFDSVPDDTVADTVPDATVADSVADSVADETVDSVPVATVADTAVPVGEADGRGVAKLADAIEQSSSATGYRITTVQGQTLQVPGMGIDQVTELDRSVPASVVEVDAAGETMATIDIAALFGGGEFDGEVDLVTWQDDAQVIIDTTDYELLVPFDPTLETSPFRPGIFRVDIVEARSSGVENIVELIVGEGVLDPAGLAVALQSALGTAEVVAGESNTFDVSTTYAEFIEATGQDLDTLARGLAAGIAPGVGVGVDELTELYVEAYRAAPADIRVTIDETGVDTIELDSDISQIWEMIPELIAETDPTVDEAQIAELFDGGVLRVELFVDFDIDDSIDVVVPDGEFEDRTAEAVELFAG